MRPLFRVHRIGLAARMVIGGMLVSALLWLGLDAWQSREIEAMVGGQVHELLTEKARRDRLRLDNAVRSHHAFVGLMTHMEPLRDHARGLAAAAVPPEIAGEPDWLPSRQDRRAFPRIDWLVLLDDASRTREVVAVNGEASPPELFALTPRILRTASQQTMLLRLGEMPALVSVARLGDGWVATVSRLDTRFIMAANGRYLDSGFAVVLFDSATGRVVASSNPEELAPGTDFHAVAERYIIAGKDFFDSDTSELRLTFASLAEHARVAAMSRPLLTYERAQRTGLAAAMSALFLGALLYLAWRVRRLTGRVATMTREVFGVEACQVTGDELAGLEHAVGRLVSEVRLSREALRREEEARLGLITEQLRVKAENERLHLLQKVTEELGVGIIRVEAIGARAENAVMAFFADECGGLDAFLAADADGLREVRFGEGKAARIFEITTAHELDLGLLLVEDVTERRRAEEVISSLALFPAQNPFPVVRIDPAGVIQHANSASVSLLHLWRTDVGKAVPESWRPLFADALADGKRREVEVIIGERVLSLTIVPLPAAGYVNIYGADVTARVAAERALFAANETLEQRVLERTEALQAEMDGHIRAEEAARAAREQAELANRAKTEFLANVSHELRTPLNAIIGFSEVMASQLFGPLAERYAVYAGDILNSGRHLLAVINDILDVSKIEAGEMGLEVGPVDVPEVVASTLRLMESRANQGGVGLAMWVAEDLPAFEADRRRVLQVLVNLVANAVKFTEAGGTVEVAVQVEASEMVFIVADTGIGMSPDEVAVALKTFGQVDGSLGRRYEGAGLGLPLSRALVEMHGGRMDIASRKGEGTTVTVRLPLSQAARQGAPQALAG